MFDFKELTQPILITIIIIKYYYSYKNFGIYFKWKIVFGNT